MDWIYGFKLILQSVKPLQSMHRHRHPRTKRRRHAAGGWLCLSKEFVDIMPTLIDLAGLAMPDVCPTDASKVKLCREGSSLKPVIASPATTKEWRPAAFMQYVPFSAMTHFSCRVHWFLLRHIALAVPSKCQATALTSHCAVKPERHSQQRRQVPALHARRRNLAQCMQR